jgi:hypothetical protein
VAFGHMPSFEPGRCIALTMRSCIRGCPAATTGRLAFFFRDALMIPASAIAPDLAARSWLAVSTAQPYAVSSGAIQVSSAGSWVLQNDGSCPPGENPPDGGVGS